PDRHAERRHGQFPEHAASGLPAVRDQAGHHRAGRHARVALGEHGRDRDNDYRRGRIRYGRLRGRVRTDMSPLSVQILISAVGVVLSMVASAFISGTRWGRIESDMRSMTDRLARIEGMFTLVPRDALERRDPAGRE